MVIDVEATATNNHVNAIAKSLSCALTIGTYSASKTSGTNWYTSTFTTKVDGDTQTSGFGKWSSYIATQEGYASLGQKSALTDFEAGDTDVEAIMWLFLSSIDQTD
jgi:hypothetical protein